MFFGGTETPIVSQLKNDKATRDRMQTKAKTDGAGERRRKLKLCQFLASEMEYTAEPCLFIYGLSLLVSSL